MLIESSSAKSRLKSLQSYLDNPNSQLFIHPNLESVLPVMVEIGQSFEGRGFKTYIEAYQQRLPNLLDRLSLPPLLRLQRDLESNNRNLDSLNILINSMMGGFEIQGLALRTGRMRASRSLGRSDVSHISKGAAVWAHGNELLFMHTNKDEGWYVNGQTVSGREEDIREMVLRSHRLAVPIADHKGEYQSSVFAALPIDFRKTSLIGDPSGIGQNKVVRQLPLH